MIDLAISIIVTTILGTLLGAVKLLLFRGVSFREAFKTALLVCVVIDLLLVIVYFKWGLSIKSFVWQ